jgi:hypothetical protein
MLMANNQFLIEHIQNSGQSAHPTQTLRSSNGAMTVANTRTSVILTVAQMLTLFAVYVRLCVSWMSK